MKTDKILYFGSNMKMFHGIAETAAYLKELEKLTSDIDRTNVRIFLMPPALALPASVQAADPEKILLGVQNVSWESSAALTGENSTDLLKELDIHLVLIGHSERREHFSETSEMENKKIAHALEEGFSVVYAVGETADDREYSISDEALQQQLKIGLHNISPEYADRLIIMYEPVWAIGEHGRPATAEYANERHLAIRRCLTEIFGRQADKTAVVYGGSANAENAADFIVQPYIDGVCATRGAWPAGNFNRMIRNCLSAFKQQS